MKGRDPRFESTRDVEREVASLRRNQQRGEAEDVVIEAPRRLFLRSPDGTYWRLDVDNDGLLSTANMGSVL